MNRQSRRNRRLALKAYHGRAKQRVSTFMVDVINRGDFNSPDIRQRSHVITIGTSPRLSTRGKVAGKQ